MLAVRHIVLPKYGNAFDECEDSIFIYPKKLKGSVNVKFAVADGATESSFSKEWASLLTSSIKGKAHVSKGNLIKILPRLQNEWKDNVFSRPLPYYAEAKAQQGAFATFIGLQINQNNYKYKCVAIGDCCFFHLRKNTLIQSFPIKKSESFSNNPFLISSNQSRNSGMKDYLFENHGVFIQGDKIFLMSDAIAFWFLDQYESKNNPWEIIENLLDNCLLNNDSFEDWLNQNRHAKAIKNDDTSIISIEIK